MCYMYLMLYACCIGCVVVVWLWCYKLQLPYCADLLPYSATTTYIATTATLITTVQLHMTNQITHNYIIHYTYH